MYECKSALLSLTMLYSGYNCAVQSVEFCQTSTLMDGLLPRNTEVRGAAIGNTKKRPYLDFTKTKAKLSFLETFIFKIVCENKVLLQTFTS